MIQQSHGSSKELKMGGDNVENLSKKVKMLRTEVRKFFYLIYS